jgi:hypothetical protein
MRKLCALVNAAMIASLLTACGNIGPGSAINAALKSKYVRGLGFGFPSKAGSKACHFSKGGPSPGLLYEARCATSVKQGPRHSYVVRFVVRRPRHVWEVKVSAQGAVVHTREYGDFGPWEEA